MGEWYEVKGSVKPAAIDTTSSQYYVYERKDIEKCEEKDENQNVTFSGYKYKEKKTPKEQWAVEAAAKTIQNVEAIMLGMTDLYEIGIGGL